ncbi:FecR family protein [Flexithrix dorotheae]|uniref:FecR family protein n=1 Tax=Flexithrix dorotheae TaxID=70993 RepID=UPI00035D15BA|nr:FecR family protein [Flexithrix dorotheae]
MNRIENIISKYLSGKELNPEELIELEDWKNLSEKNSQIYNTISGYWRKNHYRHNEVKDRVWDTIKKGVEGENKRDYNKVKNAKSRGVSMFSQTWVKYAAAVSILLLSTLILYFNYKPANEIISDNLAVRSLIEKNVPNGQKITLKLADGSSVKVNSASTLLIPERFEGTQRVVSLEGEAFFKVTENKRRPFIIKTGKVETLVVGTSFNISSYQDQNYIEVAVEEGIVEVSNTEKAGETHKITLIEGEKGIFLKESGEFIKREIEEGDFAWKDDIIFFNKVGFEEMVEVLERWYGLKFVVKRNVVFEKGISGNFKRENIKNVLESLSYSGGFKYRITKNKVVIY